MNEYENFLQKTFKEKRKIIEAYAVETISKNEPKEQIRNGIANKDNPDGDVIENGQKKEGTGITEDN
jgi:hypothetical protein